MRLFKTTYMDRDGGRGKPKAWYIEFRDHVGVVRRLAAFPDKSRTRDLGGHVERLVSFRARGLPPDDETARWLEGVSPGLRARLAKRDLLDGRAEAASRPLGEHVTEYERWLREVEHDTRDHAQVVATRLRRVFFGDKRRGIEGCGFEAWHDISASKVATMLGRLRKDREERRGISARTYNGYLMAVKQFCAWVIAQKGAGGASPVVDSPMLNQAEDPRHPRRAFTVDELRRLLEAAERGPEIRGMTGKERRLIYVVAAETGLRQAELRGLRVSDFDLDRVLPAVTPRAATTKNGRGVTLPLRLGTTADLRRRLAGKAPDEPAFNMPARWHVLEAFKADLDAAGVLYMDVSGRFADFHALRHSFVTNLAEAGAHPRDAQDLARHGTVELTMRCYTHPRMANLRAAVERLPDLSSRPVADAARATGTYGGKLTSVSAERSAEFCGRAVDDSGQRWTESLELPTEGGLGARRRQAPGGAPGLQNQCGAR